MVKVIAPKYGYTFNDLHVAVRKGLKEVTDTNLAERCDVSDKGTHLESTFSFADYDTQVGYTSARTLVTITDSKTGFEAPRIYLGYRIDTTNIPVVTDWLFDRKNGTRTPDMADVTMAVIDNMDKLRSEAAKIRTRLKADYSDFNYLLGTVLDYRDAMPKRNQMPWSYLGAAIDELRRLQQNSKTATVVHWTALREYAHQAWRMPLAHRARSICMLATSLAE